MIDFNKLMSEAPELLGELKGLGLSERQAGEFGEALGAQLLGGGAGLGSLLQGLDADELLSRIDLGALAGRLGIDPTVAAAAVRQIAPYLGSLSGRAGGSLGTLAGRLFDRD